MAELNAARSSVRAMTRLHAEFQRLYLLSADAGSSDAGLTRALVLELARPADWGLLGDLWRGVQTDLGLPAPGIAVNGTDGIQLWFSLVEPVSRLRGHAWLEGLCGRYLVGVARQRLTLMPGVSPSPDMAATGHAPWVPALQADTGNWSAFLAPDLAPIFEETPWLDIPPGDDGQAHLLSSLSSIQPDRFDAAEALLCASAALAGPPAAALTGLVGATPVADLPQPADVAAQEARGFLRALMKDPAQPMALRIEAAKALLSPTR